MKTYSTFKGAMGGAQPGDMIVRLRLPTDSLYAIVPAHAVGEVKIDRIHPATGQCVGQEVSIG